MRRIGALIAFLAVLAGQAWASSSAEQPYRIDSHGRLVTDVYVDGHGPFTFLIDTASSRSLIFEHVRKQLGLAQSQPKRLTIYGINDVAEVMPVKPSELRVAGESVHGLTLGVGIEVPRLDYLFHRLALLVIRDAKELEDSVAPQL